MRRLRVTGPVRAEMVGQEYAERRDFKKNFRSVLRQVPEVYPDARVESVPGGLHLRASRSPNDKARIPLDRDWGNSWGE